MTIIETVQLITALLGLCMTVRRWLQNHEGRPL